jgi:hypothetical protein
MGTAVVVVLHCRRMGGGRKQDGELVKSKRDN